MIDIPMVTRPAIGLRGLADPKFGSKQQSPQARPASPPRPAPPPQAGPAPRPASPPPPRPAPPPPRRERRQHPAPTGTMVQKGQKTSLTGMNPNLDLIQVGLGWDLGPGGQDYELDVEAFLLGSDGRVVGDDWFVFYNQPASPDGAVRLLESGGEDDAAVQVRLRQLHAGVARIAFIVTINAARERGYHFGNVRNAYVRIADRQASRELVRFNLQEYYNTVCSMIVGEIYRYKDEWRFNPVGDGTGDDLMGLCKRFGVNATD